MKISYKSTICNWIEGPEIKTKSINYAKNVTRVIIDCIYVTIGCALNDEAAFVNREVEWFTAHRAGGIAWA